MKKTAAFLVDKRRLLLCLFLALAAVSLPLAGRVNVNYDRTRYLPGDSPMRDGIRRMEQEFGQEASSDLRVMIGGLAEDERDRIGAELSGMARVSAVRVETDGDGYTLYQLTADCDSHAEEAAALFRAVRQKYAGAQTAGSIHDANVPVLAPHMVAAAVGLVLLILLAMCHSWFEPVVFLANIGIAVAINLGTNVVFAGISEYTAAIVGIMQLVLSMDYSIILLNRYTQEKEKAADPPSAMKAAIAAAFPAVAGSSLTTFAGLTCLAFMRFGLGADMGFALAKGVAVSLVCIFTVLPSLILISDPVIERTRKKAAHIPMGRYARFADRHRIACAALFAVLFAGAFFLKDSTGILYMLQTGNPVDARFEPRHTLALLYEKKDAARIGDVMAPFEEDPKIADITGYYNTLGKAYRAEEIAELFGGGGMADPAMIRTVYRLYAARNGLDGDAAMTPAELVSFLRNSVLRDPLFGGMIPPGIREQIGEAGALIAENAARLEGERYGRVILTTRYPEDSAETRAFLRSLADRCESMLEGETWLIGTSVMNDEMARTFDAELNRITLLSAAAIFAVVAFTFRSLVIPAVLVMTVQCGIYLTMALIGLSGGGMYYLALLMVQCILMGATIDYGILYTSYYRECRGTTDRPEALRSAYGGSLHTILTSALIMIVAAGILGFVFANPAIGEICLVISRGAISAAVLIIFLLPGVLAALDRLVISKKSVK